jgi:transcriptional regulator with XRE-family HTH domain
VSTRRKATSQRTAHMLTVAQVREILDYPRISLDDLARAAGVTKSALEAYRSGRRHPSLRVRTRLASYLDHHANQLHTLVRRLRGHRGGGATP